MKHYEARDSAHFMVRLKCVNLRGDGLTASQVAAKLGVTKNTVIGHWWRFDNGNGKTLAHNRRSA